MDNPYAAALARAKKNYNRCTTDAERRILEDTFPELKPDKSEQIRAALTEYMRGLPSATFPLKGFRQEEYMEFIQSGKIAQAKAFPFVPTKEQLEALDWSLAILNFGTMDRRMALSDLRDAIKNYFQKQEK